MKADSGSSLRSADFEPSPLQTPRLSPPSVQEDLSLLQQLPDLKSKKENLGAALFDDKGVSECEILEACKDPKEKAEETIAIIDLVGVVVGDKSSKISPPSSPKVGEVKEDCNEVGPSSSKEQLEDDADSVDVIDMSDNELSAAAANSMPNNSTDAFESASPKMSNRFWAAQFKERRERRLAQIEKQKVNKQQLVTQTAAAATSVAASAAAADVTIVPDTPEKKADQDDDLDWGDDCFPSVEDVDGHKVLRTPLRESNNGTADTANKSDNLEEVSTLMLVCVILMHQITHTMEFSINFWVPRFLYTLVSIIRGNRYYHSSNVISFIAISEIGLKNLDVSVKKVAIFCC